jgi:UDP-N-acetylmuramate dehydrogenase
VNIIENQSLKTFNTFGIDVKTAYFAEFYTENELIELLTKFQNYPKLLLGQGSNVLFTKDFEGVVLKNCIKNIKILDETENHVKISVGAGENWHQFVLYSLENNYFGLENLSLIYGTVGAAPMQNIGAYGVEVKSFIDEVKALEISTQKIRTFSNKECDFGYRESVFKKELKNKYIITEVVFVLNKKENFKLEYGDINKILANKNIKNPTAKDVSQAVCEIRNSKLPNPNEIGNAGSFFKNPEIDKDIFENIQKKFPEMPFYPTNLPNKIKVPAGWLIEKANWKGKKKGNAGVHEKQALVLVNYGKAEGKEILEIAEEIQKDVLNSFGIQLFTEVNIY